MHQGQPVDRSIWGHHVGRPDPDWQRLRAGQGSLSWFVESYSSLANWKATVDRLLSFQDAIEQAAARAAAGGIERVSNGVGDVRVKDVELRLPGGRTILADTSIAIEPGERVLISGPTGVGKSTLFRALAGIWPFGTGQILVPTQANLLFLPQRAYLPIASLRDAVTYPAASGTFDDAAIGEALAATGLASFVGRLDDVELGLQLARAPLCLDRHAPTPASRSFHPAPASRSCTSRRVVERPVARLVPAWSRGPAHWRASDWCSFESLGWSPPRARSRAPRRPAGWPPVEPRARSRRAGLRAGHSRWGGRRRRSGHPRHTRPTAVARQSPPPRQAAGTPARDPRPARRARPRLACHARTSRPRAFRLVRRMPPARTGVRRFSAADVVDRSERATRTTPRRRPRPHRRPVRPTRQSPRQDRRSSRPRPSDRRPSRAWSGSIQPATAPLIIGPRRNLLKRIPRY